MSDAKPEAHQNVYLQNAFTGATTNLVRLCCMIQKKENSGPR